MRVQITERHCSVPEEVRERAEEQIGALAKYDPRMTAAEVVFTEEKLTRSIEVRVRVDGAEPVVARGESDEFRSALDQLVDRLSRRLREQRKRRMDHQAPPLAERIGGE